MQLLNWFENVKDKLLIKFVMFDMEDCNFLTDSFPMHCNSQRSMQILHKKTLKLGSIKKKLV